MSDKRWAPLSSIASVQDCCSRQCIAGERSVGEKLRKTQNPGERVAQLVAHDGQKLALGRSRLFRFCRGFLKLAVDPQDLFGRGTDAIRMLLVNLPMPTLS